MATWISLVVLSALAVSALSLPRPDGAYKIPRVGTGRRSQYSILHRDGTYKYGHDTGEGAFESARSTRVGEKTGRFGYVDPDGNPIRIQYEAGEEGFVPTGSHIPQLHPDFHAAHAEARARPPFVDPLANPFADASYGFQFDEEGHRRSEQSDSKGNVRGSYSYVDEEGNIRTYAYTAGRNIGFVVTGNDLPVSPDTPGSSGSTPADTSYSSAGGRIFSSTLRGSGSTISSPGTSASTSSASGSANPTSSSVAAVRYSTGAHSATQSAIGNDGSYSFSFNSGDQSRSEAADANLNVEGQFSFVADDGVRRRVNYEAGANRGFTASGDHLPVAPSASGATSSHSAHGSTSLSTASQSFYKAPSTTSFSSFSSPAEEANTRANLRPDGSYSLEYETSSHSRQEAGDRKNNVDGDFTFVADDGQARQIKFEAGAETGFIAEGDHIPVGPVVPGAPSGQPTGKIVPVRQVPFYDPFADSNADASYNFAFDSEQYSRSETADSDGNVRGTYTVVDDDGTHRTYRFRAGEGTGFETQQVSSYKGPKPSKTAYSASSSAFQHGAASSSASSSTGTFSSSATGYTAGPSSSSQGIDTSDFQLRQYEASKNPNKFGYVLTFKN